MFDNRFDRCYDMGTNGQYQNMQVDPGLDMNNEMQNANYQGDEMRGCNQDPIVEQGYEKCVHRTFCHEVEHICPINTRVINHHVYKHVYKPCYTCCEENQISHINEGSCCCFR